MAVKLLRFASACSVVLLVGMMACASAQQSGYSYQGTYINLNSLANTATLPPIAVCSSLYNYLATTSTNILCTGQGGGTGYGAFNVYNQLLGLSFTSSYNGIGTFQCTVGSSTATVNFLLTANFQAALTANPINYPSLSLAVAGICQAFQGTIPA
jgi:hypothetical protein